MSTIDPLFGIHADALAIQKKRMEVLASNLANADTPHYQARDIDFASMLANEQKSGSASSTASTLTTTQQDHISSSTSDASLHDPTLLYRVPLQPSVDGNTVDEQVEQGKYLDAALHYQASLTFLNGKIKDMLTAITGQ